MKLMKFCRIKIKDGNIIRAFIKMKNRHITRNRNRKETLGQNHRIEHKAETASQGSKTTSGKRLRKDWLWMFDCVYCDFYVHGCCRKFFVNERE